MIEPRHCGGIVDDGDWLRTLDTNTLYRYLEKAGEFVRPYIYAGYDGDMSLPMEPEPKKDPVPKYRETRWAKMLKGK